MLLSECIVHVCHHSSLLLLNIMGYITQGYITQGYIYNTGLVIDKFVLMDHLCKLTCVNWSNSSAVVPTSVIKEAIVSIKITIIIYNIPAMIGKTVIIKML